VSEAAHCRCVQLINQTPGRGQYSWRWQSILPVPKLLSSYEQDWVAFIPKCLSSTPYIKWSLNFWSNLAIVLWSYLSYCFFWGLPLKWVSLQRVAISLLMFVHSLRIQYWSFLVFRPTHHQILMQWILAAPNVWNVHGVFVLNVEYHGISTGHAKNISNSLCIYGILKTAICTSWLRIRIGSAAVSVVEWLSLQRVATTWPAGFPSFCFCSKTNHFVHMLLSQVLCGPGTRMCCSHKWCA
jgi:hypothetical protein